MFLRLSALSTACPVLSHGTLDPISEPVTASLSELLERPTLASRISRVFRVRANSKRYSPTFFPAPRFGEQSRSLMEAIYHPRNKDDSNFNHRRQSANLNSAFRSPEVAFQLSRNCSIALARRLGVDFPRNIDSDGTPGPINLRRKVDIHSRNKTNNYRGFKGGNGSRSLDARTRRLIYIVAEPFNSPRRASVPPRDRVGTLEACSSRFRSGPRGSHGSFLRSPSTPGSAALERKRASSEWIGRIGQCSPIAAPREGIKAANNGVVKRPRNSAPSADNEILIVA